MIFHWLSIECSGLSGEARMVPLRAAFAELADERDEHRVWMRHFN